LVTQTAAGEPNTQVDNVSPGVFAERSQIGRASPSIGENQVMNLARDIVCYIFMKRGPVADDDSFGVVGKSLEVVRVERASQVDDMSSAVSRKEGDLLGKDIDFHGGERACLCGGEANDQCSRIAPT